MNKSLLKNKKAVSSVVSSIILCASVLVIGTTVWGFACSAGMVLQKDYYREVSKEIDSLRERFIIENVAYDNSTGNNTIHVWVYNYGDVEIEIDVYALRSGEVIGGNLTGIVISSNKIEVVTLTPESIQSGDDLVIKAVSRRGNVAYETYRVT